MKKWLGKLATPSIKTKLLGSFLAVSLIPLIALGVINFYFSKDAMIESNKGHLKSLVDNAYILAETLNNEAKAGKITQEEAQEKFRIAIAGEKQPDGTRKTPTNLPRIGDGDYFFAYNKEIRAVMHPKNFEGQIKDQPNELGVNANRDMYNQKEGYYTFLWKNPGETEPREKIAYLRYFKEWDWVIVMGSYYDNFYEKTQESKEITIYMLLVGLVLVTTVSLLIASSITKRINRVKTVMECMGQGDFTTRVAGDERDELGQMGQALNETIDKISEVLSQVKESSRFVKNSADHLAEGAHQLKSASTEIASSVEDVSQGSEQQSDTLQNLSSYMEELAASFEDTSHNMASVNSMAVKAREASIDGKENIQGTIKQMGSIKDSVQEIQEVITLLNQRTKEISNFVTVITDISSQTNLLALNAAIEAARAGEHGKGFAVVAEEVRKLAEQSAKSAEEIKSIIGSIIEESERSRETVRISSEAVLEGTEVVKEAGQGFDQILSFVNQVAQGIENVNRSIQEVNKGAQDISSSVTELGAFNEQTNASTQNVAALIEEQNAMAKEIHAATETLAHQANSLDDMTKRFTV
ncbi:methyl-accepting chemotaxis protein [Aneurinibacillus sp. REN35]|uniref:methyl-accepting chemotaxis protein n=1 Tax=Aneurinibacillus sp. REN35 TaxID=3237286 RepID=UPI0035296938